MTRLSLLDAPVRDVPTNELRLDDVRNATSIGDVLPNPVITWFTSSVHEAHPGKRFHASAWCSELSKVRRLVETDRTFLEVGSRHCSLCLDRSGQDLLPAKLTYRVAGALNALAASAAAIERSYDDVGKRDKAVRASLHLAKYAVWDVHQHGASTLGALLADLDVELNRLHIQAHALVADVQKQQRLTLWAAAALHNHYPKRIPSLSEHSPDTHPPMLSGDYRSLGSVTLRGAVFAGPDAWRKFCLQLLEGSGLQAAAHAAEGAFGITASKLPSSMEQLPLLFDVPAGATSLSLGDIMHAWRTQAARDVDDLVSSWVTLTRETLERQEQLDHVQLIVPNLPHTVSRVMTKIVENFPSQQYKKDTVVLTVPVAIASWMMTLGQWAGQQVTLLPHGRNTSAVLDLVSSLMDNQPGLNLVDALTLAHGVLAEPTVS